MYVRYSKIFGLWLTLMGAVACSSSGRQVFTAEGIISDAEGQMLYLEEVGTGNVLSLDSLRLSKEGKFSFSHEGTYYPMFYRLRLGNASIPFVADSATHIVLSSKGDSFFASYNIKEADKYNHQIRDIALQRYAVDKSIDSLITLYNKGAIERTEAERAIKEKIDHFKRDLTTHYIYVEPKSPAAYFALFQQKDERTYFSVDNEGDERAFAAVATAYETFYAEAPYTSFLKDIALEALTRARVRRRTQEQVEQLASNAVSIPEIKLKDSQGVEHSLTAFAQEKPTILSFTSYQGAWSPKLVASLKQVCSKRPDLQVFEVSLDTDMYYWRNAVRALPWLCLNDTEGKSATLYNVQSLPTLYLIEHGAIKRLSKPEEVLQ